MNHHYTKCLINGTGKILNNGIDFQIIDISAIEADILLTNQLKIGKIYDIEVAFTSNLIQFKFNTKASFENEKMSDDKFSYKAKFIGLEEYKKIEIDETLKNTCIIKEQNIFNKCEYGYCKINYNTRG